MVDGRRRREILQTYDLGVGFFGFFAVAFFLVSLFFQLGGRDPIWASLTALVAFAVLGAIWMSRRRFLRRSRDGD